MSTPSLEEITRATLRDLKEVLASQSEMFDRWHALAKAIVSDNAQDSAAWATLRAQLERS